jgi:Domain of unknown function (DUF1707)
MTQDPRLRAGDADRDRVAEILRENYTAGRLDRDELDQRLEAAYAAKTFGDLDRLLLDLPPPPSPVQPVSPARAPARPQPGRPPDRSRSNTALKAAWGAWATVVGINVVVWLLVSIMNQDWIYPWPVWVAGPWGVVLVVATVFSQQSQQGRDNSP